MRTRIQSVQGLLSTGQMLNEIIEHSIRYTPDQPQIVYSNTMTFPPLEQPGDNYTAEQLNERLPLAEDAESGSARNCCHCCKAS